MNTVDNLDLSKPDAAAQKLAPALEAGYKTFSAATWALRLWKWVVRPVARIAVGTMRGVWWLLKNGNQYGNRRNAMEVAYYSNGRPVYKNGMRG